MELSRRRTDRTATDRVVISFEHAGTASELSLDSAVFRRALLGEAVYAFAAGQPVQLVPSAQPLSETRSLVTIEVSGLNEDTHLFLETDSSTLPHRECPRDRWRRAGDVFSGGITRVFAD